MNNDFDKHGLRFRPSEVKGKTYPVVRLPAHVMVRQNVIFGNANQIFIEHGIYF